jgi:hypothetical protein
VSFAAVCGPFGFNFDWAGVSCGVVVETTPSVVFGFGDEAAVYGVAVDVANLLYEFRRREDIEVVVTRLPEMGSFVFQELRGFAFDDSHGRGEGMAFRFAQEEMNMLGHDDVSVEREVMGSTGSLDDLFQGVLGVGC